MITWATHALEMVSLPLGVVGLSSGIALKLIHHRMMKVSEKGEGA